MRAEDREDVGQDRDVRDGGRLTRVHRLVAVESEAVDVPHTKDHRGRGGREDPPPQLPAEHGTLNPGDANADVLRGVVQHRRAGERYRGQPPSRTRQGPAAPGPACSRTTSSPPSPPARPVSPRTTTRSPGDRSI